MAIKSTKIGPGVLTIGSDAGTQFASQARSVKLTPKVDTEDPFYVLSGEMAEGDRTESFTLNGQFVQDFGQESSTTEWLFEHRGERHPFVFVPNSVTGRQVTGDLVVEAIEIGGDANTKPSSDFEFVLVGEPQISAVE